MPTFTRTVVVKVANTNDETVNCRWVTNTNHLDMSRCLWQSPWQVRDKHVSVGI